jgi:mannitol/fructose-specific phosphotransferase system IIA component
LLERERLASTGVGDYIAFPHTYIPDYCPYVVMVCYSDCPIYWSSSDGKPVRFFALSLYSNRDPNVKLRIQLALNKTFVKYKFRIVQKNDYKGDLLDKIVDSLYLVLSEQQISLEKQDTIFQVL